MQRSIMNEILIFIILKTNYFYYGFFRKKLENDDNFYNIDQIKVPVVNRALPFFLEELLDILLTVPLNIV